MFLSSAPRFPTILLQSSNSEFMRTVEVIKRVAHFNCTVLIEGESGTGKEVLSTLLHEESPRAPMPFIKVNCGAIPDALVESELFGYEGGAFTGAKKEGNPGLFEQADKGTILLDEIGELPPLMQVKLLRALQEREIRRVGGSWSKSVDVRVIASTNQNLPKLVEKGAFRSDLYYRLQVVQISVPPLRQRKEDLPAFLEFFLDMFPASYGRTRKTFSAEAREALLRYDWPGNIRQLRNCMEGLYATVEEELITVEDLPPFLKESALAAGSPLGLREQLSSYEKRLIEQAVMRTNSLRQAAISLDLPHATLLRKMEKLGIDRKEAKRGEKR